MTVELGRLESLDIRGVWQSEPRDFTVWLAEAENLGLLGDALGLHLELEGREHSVGSFSADILARDPGQNLTVVIENQLDPTDHKHLGQIITYASGVQANVIVWVAPEFREEHRAAIDWLNQATIPGFNFFAVQIEAYRIGDSLAAPRFSIVAKPNSWSKKASEAKRLAEGAPSESKRRWSGFWGGLKIAAVTHFAAVSERATASGNWQPILSITKSNDLYVSFNITASRGGLRIELYIDGLLAKATFRSFEAEAPSIQAALTETVVWELLPDARASRICVYMPGASGADHANPNAQYNWIIATAPGFISALRPLADRLSPSKLLAAEQLITEG